MEEEKKAGEEVGKEEIKGKTLWDLFLEFLEQKKAGEEKKMIEVV